MKSRYTFFIGPNEKPLQTSNSDGAGFYAQCIEQAISQLEEANDRQDIKNVISSFINAMKSQPITQKMINHAETGIKSMLKSNPDKQTIINALTGIPVPGQGYLCISKSSDKSRFSPNG